MGAWARAMAGRVLLLAAQLAVCVGAANAQQAAAVAPGQPASSTILIFDGSGSMWGKIEGEKQIKLELAKEAVRAALAKLPPASMQLGLASFGHRRSGDCSDVQVIVAPDAADGSAFSEHIMTPLDKLDPRGKGPLTAALREAAKVLGKLPAPHNIVLIHDDPDNCKEDPCAEVSDFQKTAQGVVISVIGLGLKPDDATKYECLTKPTGGRHFNAQNAADIAAGVGDALQLAAAAGIPAPPAAVKPQAAAPRLAPKDAEAAVVEAAAAAAVAKPIELVRTGPPELRLRALLVKDRLPIGQRVHWLVYAASAPDGSVPVAEADGIDATLPIAAGGYRLRATSGLVSADTTVTAPSEGQALAEVTFGAAELRLKAPLPGDAALIVAERDADVKPLAATSPGGKPQVPPLPPPLSRRLGLWTHGETSMLVPARPLWLQLSQGQVRALWPLDIAAGQAREIDAARPGSRVEVTLAPTAGPLIAGAGPFASQPVVFTLEEDDPDSPRGRREVARSSASSAEFVVPPGVYMIAATRGTLETRERISVVAGEVVRRALPLVAARLIIGARLGAGSAPSAADGDASDSFRISRLDVDAGEPIIMAGPAAVADVPPGRYRIEARRENAAIKAEQVVEVRAGDYRPVTLDYQAGELRMEAPAGPEAEARLFWRIVDGNGRLMWSGSDPKAVTLLQAGRYSVRWVVQGQRRERAVDVRAGAVSTVRLGPQL